jgi:hypothetical protein
MFFIQANWSKLYQKALLGPDLRAFIYKTKQCPPAILACQSIFRRLVDPRVRNTLISDMATFEPVADVQAAVWNPGARLLTIFRRSLFRSSRSERLSILCKLF